MKYGKSPPDEGDNQETLEASGPLWQAVARLIDDEESAHDVHCQLQRAMVTRGLAEVLSQESQRKHVATTSKLVVVELDKLQPDQDANEQQRRQQILLATLTIISSANDTAMAEHALQVQEEHEASTAVWSICRQSWQARAPPPPPRWPLWSSSVFRAYTNRFPAWLVP